MHLALHHDPRRAPRLSRRSVAPAVARSGQRRTAAMGAHGRPADDAVRWSRLIEAVAIAQDRTAFAALFEHFAPRVKAYMLRSGAIEASAEEVAQETMLSVWRKAVLFDPASTGAAAWIFTIARNLRIDALRREQRGGMREAKIDLEQHVVDSPAPDSQLTAAQYEKRVRDAMAQLSDEQKRVVELSFFEEQAHAEIAQQLPARHRQIAAAAGDGSAAHPARRSVMTILHQPSDVMLAAFAAGTLDQGQQMAIATHFDGCARCRAFVGAMEHVGGAVLDRLPPAAMTTGALAQVMGRLDDPAPRPIRVAPLSELDDVPGLPDIVRRCRAGSWRWVGPGVHVRPIMLPQSSPTRLFLLKAAPGTRMLQHSHTEQEMTCVLKGAFSHEGGRFGPGDFDLGDEEVDHRPLVEQGEECICLVAMRGELRLSGLVGRAMQPIVRL